MNSGRKYLAVAGALLLAAASLLSCYPGDELNYSDTDAVLTLFDPNADFSTKRTYAMPDTVIYLVASGEDDDDVNRDYDDTILESIEEGLLEMGFLPADSSIADVHVLTAALVSDYVGYYSYGWYWDYWYGYPVGGGWYPYYPSGGYAYSYSVGTIFVMMFDRTTVDDDPENAKPIWSAALNGLADRTTNATRIASGIEQAFTQSQYLRAGK